MSGIRRYRILVTFLVSLLIAILFTNSGFAQCGNADADPYGGIDISDLSAIGGYLVQGQSIPSYSDADVDGYQDVTISDYYYLQSYFYCNFGLTFDRCGTIDSALNPPTRKGDYVFVDNNLYPHHSGGQTIYFNMYVRTIDTIQGFSLPFQVWVGDSLAKIVSMTNPYPSGSGIWQMGYFTDSSHGLVVAKQLLTGDCYVPPGSYNVVKVGFRGPVIYGPNDTTFSVVWSPYPTPVNPTTLQPVYKPLFVLKSYTSPDPPNPMQTVIAVTPEINPPQCLACGSVKAVLGSAIVTDSAVFVLVDSLGTSGSSGVSLEMTSQTTFSMLELNPLQMSEPGAEARVAVRGTLFGSASSQAQSALIEFGNCLVQSDGSVLRISGDFSALGSSQLLLRVANGTSVIFQDTVQNAVELASVIGTDNSLPSVHRVFYYQPSTMFNVSFDRTCSITPVGGVTVTGNKITLSPIGRSVNILTHDEWILTGKSTRFIISNVSNGPPQVCCPSTSGDLDCSDRIDISDLSILIDFLYISHPVLCCLAQANCDGSLDGGLDIGDLTALIDYLYISFTPTAGCL